MLVPLTLLLQVAAAGPPNCVVANSGYYCQSVVADYQTPWRRCRLFVSLRTARPRR